MLTEKRWSFAWLATLAAFLLSSSHVHAQVAVVGVKSVDAVLASGKYLGGMAGEPGVSEALSEFVRKISAGVDTSRPLGLYLDLPTKPGDKLTVAAFVPITSREKFIKVAAEFGAQVTPAENDLHSVTWDGEEYVLRFTEKYAFAAGNPEFKNAKLIDPEKEVGFPGSRIVDAHLHMSRVPDVYRLYLLKTWDEFVKTVGREDEFLYQYVKLCDGLSKNYINDLWRVEHFDLNLELDEKQHVAALNFTSVDKEPSSNADRPVKLSSRTKYLAEGALASITVRDKPSDKNLDKEFSALLDSTLAPFLTFTGDAKLRTGYRRIMALLEGISGPEGEDYTFALHGPFKDGTFCVACAMHVKGGKLDRGLRDLMKNTVPGNEETVRLDVLEYGGAKIHSLEADGFNKMLSTIGGLDQVVRVGTIHFAATESAIFVTFGRSGLEMMKKTIDGWGQASPLSPIRTGVDLSLVRVLALSAKDMKVPEHIARLFAEPESDRVRLTRDDEKLRLEMSTKLLRLNSLRKDTR